MTKDNLKIKDLFWNMLGTCTYALVSFVIAIIVINILGEDKGGLFSFGYSTLSRIIFIICYFGIRPLHIVDVRYKYSFLTYRRFSKITFILSIIFGLIYISTLYILGVYSLYKVFALFLLILHGAIDGLSDYYECEYQRVNKLYMAGQSQFFRIFIFTISLILCLIFTNKLILSLIVALIFEISSFYVFNVLRGKNIIYNKSDVYDKNKIIKLFFDAFPLFMVTFFDMYIFSATKFAIDINLNDINSGFFNLIFMPTNILYLALNLIMKPLLTPFSNAYFDNKKEYNSILIKTLLLAMFISLLAIVFAIFFGNIYINIIDLVTINKYVLFKDIANKIFLVSIIGAAFYMINTPLYFSLIIENKQKYLVISYAITFLVSIIISNLFVRNFGLIGAAYGYLVNMFILCSSIILTKLLVK